MKKVISLVLSTTLVAVLCTACGTSATSSSSAPSDQVSSSDAATAPAPGGTQEPIVLRVSWWGSQARTDGTVAALNAYAAENPHVTFEYEFSDWGGYWDKLSTQAASNSLPDIIQQDYAYIAQYQSKKQLASLDTYIQNGTIDVTNVPKSILSSGVLEGQLYALCAGMNAPTIAYDKAVVDKAGVTIPDQMTYDEYEDICKTVYEKTGIKSTYPVGDSYIASVCRDFNKNMFDYAKNQLAVEESVVLQYFQKEKETIAQPWHLSMEIMAEKNADDIETKPLVDGSTWTDFLQSNQVPTLAKTAGKDLGMTMECISTDATGQSMYLKPSMFFSITESSKYKDEAAKVLNFLTNSTKAQDCLKAERGVPISTKIADYIKPTLPADQQTAFDYVAKVGEIASPIDPPNPPGFSELRKLCSDLTDKVRYGEITPEEATKKFMTEGNAILAKAAS
ncbi:extracellular solute-binding protein [Clostridium sp. WB02_MRS01]|uniref:ABC transporter substrate-binding protein n=1 Tax=Clostridium sp. WB02_MRS01 TaxID=2605777 RepID=UPI0012B4179B|nr:extracellular solute-binding protein [Clostridium sp. WB02_MRS01]MSS09293.1 extracellular solute-binding protein [Clostridium sp. WB02_MRS01]